MQLVAHDPNRPIKTANYLWLRQDVYCKASATYMYSIFIIYFSIFKFKRIQSWLGYHILKIRNLFVEF